MSRNFIVLSALLCVAAICQDTHRVPDASNPRLAEQTRQQASLPASFRRLSGFVRLSDVARPNQFIEIAAACSTFNRLMALTDSEGRFNFSFDPSRYSDQLLTGCRLVVSLDGYRSAVLSFATLAAESQRARVHFTLDPLSKNQNGLASTGDKQASDHDQRLFRKALDKASRQDYKLAIKLLTQVAAASPGFSSARLALADCQQMQGKTAEANKTYLEAWSSNPAFAIPLIRVARSEMILNDMQAALLHSQQAVEINPDRFPEAYAINAAAHLHFQHLTEAEISARAGLLIDTSHQFPELEYVLGMALYAEKNPIEAKDHLKSYVAQVPTGANNETANQKLTQIALIEQAVGKLSVRAKSEVDPRESIPDKPDLRERLAELRKSNFHLVEKANNYTCLETIRHSILLPNQQAANSNETRVDIAVVQGKEVYGEASGRNFSSNGNGNLLGQTLWTTGLFSSIAKALIAGDGLAIEPDGQFQAAGEGFDRYIFHSLAKNAGWNITYNGESGIAAEQGWFVTGSATHVLSRAFVAASEIPPNLKLISLSALIDYAPETVAGQKALLPTVAKVDAAETSGTVTSTLMSFDHCRVFGAESSLSFKEASVEQRKTPTITHLPSDLDVKVLFNSLLRLSTPEETDVVVMNVREPVKKGRTVWIDAGAPVEGHVRRIPGTNELLLQLDRVQTRFGWLPFYSRLLRLTTNGAITAGQSENMTDTEDLSTQLGTKLQRPYVPGVVILAFATRDAELPPGSVAFWKTELLKTSTPPSALFPNTSMGLQ